MSLKGTVSAGPFQSVDAPKREVGAAAAAPLAWGGTTARGKTAETGAVGGGEVTLAAGGAEVATPGPEGITPALGAGRNVGFRAAGMVCREATATVVGKAVTLPGRRGANFCSEEDSEF